jgi:hypothetical protein
MPRTLERRSLPRGWFLPQSPRAEAPAPGPSGGGWRGLVWALLVAGLVFCHGCHGDEDNELCLPLTPQAQSADKDPP